MAQSPHDQVRDMRIRMSGLLIRMRLHTVSLAIEIWPVRRIGSLQVQILAMFGRLTHMLCTLGTIDVNGTGA